jgi:hypothetical protein
VRLSEKNPETMPPTTWLPIFSGPYHSGQLILFNALDPVVCFGKCLYREFLNTESHYYGFIARFDLLLFEITFPPLGKG